jgi:hypothetical protein
MLVSLFALVRIETTGREESMSVHRLWRVGMAAGVVLVSCGFAAERAAAQKASGGVMFPDSLRGLSISLSRPAPLDGIPGTAAW